VGCLKGRDDAGIASITFYDEDSRAEIEFAQGGIDVRECRLWEAVEWAEAAGLVIIEATYVRFR
jgi:hypothetical protein